MHVILPGTDQKRWNCEHSISRVLLADAIGAIALGGLVLILALLLRRFGLSLHEWLGVYVAETVLAIGLWHVSNIPKAGTREQLWTALVSIGVGALFFLGDVLIGHFADPALPLLVAGTKASGPLGFVFTLFACPGTTLILVAGAARTFFLHREAACDA